MPPCDRFPRIRRPRFEIFIADGLSEESDPKSRQPRQSPVRIARAIFLAVRPLSVRAKRQYPDADRIKPGIARVEGVHCPNISCADFGFTLETFLERHKAAASRHVQSAVSSGHVPRRVLLQRTFPRPRQPNAALLQVQAAPSLTAHPVQVIRVCPFHGVTFLGRSERERAIIIGQIIAALAECPVLWMRRPMPRRCKNLIRNGGTFILGRAGEQLELARWRSRVHGFFRRLCRAAWRYSHCQGPGRAINLC